MLDATLEDFIYAWRAGEDPEIPDLAFVHDEVSWSAYAAWFFDLGLHVAQTPHEVEADRRPSKLNPRRYLSRDWGNDPPEHTGLLGFPLNVGNCRHDTVVVTRDGQVIPVLPLGDELLYWPRGDSDNWLDKGEPFKAVSDHVSARDAAVILRTAPLLSKSE